MKNKKEPVRLGWPAERVFKSKAEKEVFQSCISARAATTELSPLESQTASTSLQACSLASSYTDDPESFAMASPGRNDQAAKCTSLVYVTSVTRQFATAL